MMKLNKTETAAFAAIGKAITEAKDCAAIKFVPPGDARAIADAVKECAANKKASLPLIAGALAENHDDLAGEGVTIGDYKFKLVVREELTAIRV